MNKLILIPALLSLTACATQEVDRTPPAFKRGDTAIAKNFTKYPQYEGTRVTVTGDFKWRWIRMDPTLPFYSLRTYEITTVDGEKLAAQPFQLGHVK